MTFAHLLKTSYFQLYAAKIFNSPFGRLNQLQRWRDLNDLDRLHKRIARQINSADYDLLFAHPEIFTLIPRLINYIDIPVVYYLHEPFGPGFVRQSGEPGISESIGGKK